MIITDNSHDIRLILREVVPESLDLVVSSEWDLPRLSIDGRLGID